MVTGGSIKSCSNCRTRIAGAAGAALALRAAARLAREFFRWRRLCWDREGFSLGGQLHDLS